MTLNMNKQKIQNCFEKIIIYKSFINYFYSVQADSSIKHTARVKPSQYIAQHLYKETSKSNCSSCSNQTSYLTQPRSLKVFTTYYILREKKMENLKPALTWYLIWSSPFQACNFQKQNRSGCLELFSLRKFSLLVLDFFSIGLHGVRAQQIRWPEN